MLVTRPLELEALILLSLTVLRVGVPIMALYGKSLFIIAVNFRWEYHIHSKDHLGSCCGFSSTPF